MEKEQLKTILEAVLMAASSPLSIDALLTIFDETQRPEKDELNAALEEMAADCATRSYELKQVSSGYRYQVKKDYADFVSRLWEDKPARYSRALLETLALIAYRQPITRGEIEAVRGVSVSSTIIKTLDERGWIKVVGHRDVPGKPALYATTKEFLDYFNIASLDDLPSLQEIRDIDEINAELDLRMPEEHAEARDDESPDESESVDVETTAEETPAEETPVEEIAEEESHTVINLSTAGDESKAEMVSGSDADGAQGEPLDAAPASAEH